jgi:hypothetical protein
MLAPLSRPGHKPTVTDPGSAVGQGTLNRAQAPHVDDPENAGRNQAGRFTKGCSGNGTGNPKGTRNKASLLLDKMASGEAGAVLGALLEKAKRREMWRQQRRSWRASGRCRRAGASRWICRES